MKHIKHIIIALCALILAAPVAAKWDADDILLLYVNDRKPEEWLQHIKRACLNDEGKRVVREGALHHIWCKEPDLGMSKFYHSLAVREMATPISAKKFDELAILRVDCGLLGTRKHKIFVSLLFYGETDETDPRFAVSRPVTIDDEYAPTEYVVKWDNNDSVKVEMPLGNKGIRWRRMFLEYWQLPDETNFIAKMKRHNEVRIGIEIEGVGNVFYHFSLDGAAKAIAALERACVEYRASDYVEVPHFEEAKQ